VFQGNRNALRLCGVDHKSQASIDSDTLYQQLTVILIPFEEGEDSVPGGMRTLHLAQGVNDAVRTTDGKKKQAGESSSPDDLPAYPLHK